MQVEGCERAGIGVGLGLPESCQKNFPAKIISGGQTGVDRAALDVALELQIPCGGWCPAGRRAEDGRLSSRYPLQETISWRYHVRTQQNIDDSDGTLIISPLPLRGGTALTRQLALKQGKPCLIVPEQGLFLTGTIEEWLKHHKIAVLNVAGPRESSVPGIYRRTTELLKQLLSPRASPVDDCNRTPP